MYQKEKPCIPASSNRRLTNACAYATLQTYHERPCALGAFKFLPVRTPAGKYFQNKTRGGILILLHENSIYRVDGRPEEKAAIPQNEARKQTMAWQILQAHNTSGDPERLKSRFDAMVSHDITYVGIIQQARASGMKEFPIPYALTNCHNSLCAVGGTINEDDHVFGLSAAKKYGGIYVPANQRVIHS